MESILSELAGPVKEPEWAKMLRGLERTGQVSTAPSMRAQSPKRIRPAHRMIAMLAESGMKQKEIALATGYTETRVSVILRSHHPELQEIRAGFAAQVADNIRDPAMRMALVANEMVDVMVFHARRKAEDPALSQRSAKELLHMAGFSPVKKISQVDTKAPTGELGQTVRFIEEANAVVLDKRYEIQNPPQNGERKTA